MYSNKRFSSLSIKNDHERGKCLVVNHPEIVLTLEKCLLQGKNHCFLYLN